MAVLTVIMVLMGDYCLNKEEGTCPGYGLHPTNYLQILISLETLIILPVTVVYLGEYLHPDSEVSVCRCSAYFLLLWCI